MHTTNFLSELLIRPAGVPERLQGIRRYIGESLAGWAVSAMYKYANTRACKSDNATGHHLTGEKKTT